MARPSHLIFNESRTDLRTSQSTTEGEVLYHSPYGVPLVWILAFGGRNIWNPGDDVEARGGVAGKRNPYETQVEVALARLEHAETALRSDPYWWAWFSALPILRRKLALKPKTGFIRVAAPWIIGLTDQQVERWRSATAFAENAVNFAATGRLPEAALALEELKPFCPFVPRGDSSDLKAFESADPYRNDPEPLRLALLTLGQPENMEVFSKATQKECAPALEEWRKLPPRTVGSSLPAAKGTSSSPNAAGDEAAGASGILGKLTGLFRKR